MDYSGYQNLLCEQDERVLKITLNRPERMNALSRELQQDMDDILDKAVHDDSVRVLVIKGAG